MPLQLQELGKDVFKGCPNLERINLPASVTDFGEDIFDGCIKLHELAGSSEQDDVIRYLLSDKRTESE